MLQLVLGRAGSGKTTFTINSIVDKIKGGESNLLLLVPEQFSFASGNIFLSKLGEQDFNKLEISDFTRLSYEVKRIYGGETKPVLDNGGKAVMMSRAISAVQDILKLYNKKINSSGFVLSMVDIYTELKMCDVDFETLLKISEKVENKTLQNKLKDISSIMTAYETIIKDEYLDSDDDLLRLCNKLKTVDYLAGRDVYIDGFNGFTALELKVIEQILLSAKNVYINLCTDSLNDNEFGFGLFSSVKKTANKLISLARKCNVKISPAIVFQGNKRFENNPISYIESSLYRDSFNIYNKDVENVTVCKAKNIYDECDYVAREIKKLIRKENYRCKDIVVISRQAENYKTCLENAFKNYEIPYFNDDRQAISSQPLVNLIDYAFKSISSSFSTENVLSYVKTNLISVSQEDIYLLENYVYMWKISGKAWLSDFTKHPKGFVADFSENDVKLLATINDARRVIIEPLAKLKNNMTDKSGKQIAKSLYYYLREVQADINLKNIAIELEKNNLITLAQEQNRVWDIVMQILDQISITIGNDNISIREFAEMFNLIVLCQDLGNIPQGLDNVTIGSAGRIRTDNPKVAFVVGLNQGEFPQIKNVNGLLSTLDRRKLEEFDIELTSNEQEQNVLEKFIAYSALTSATEKLYLSYYTSNIKGESKTPSDVITTVLNVLPQCNKVDTSNINNIDLIESKKSAFELCASNWQENTAFSNSLKDYFIKDENYTDAISSIELQNGENDYCIKDKNIAKDLFGKEMLMSASRVETFYNCPFMYFCRYGINAQPRKIAEMDPMQLGTVIHFVFEKLFSDYSNEQLLKMEDSHLKNVLNKILTNYFENEMGLDVNENKRFSYLYFRLQKTVFTVAKKIIDEFEYSEFRTKACELSIDKDTDIKPLEVDLDDGGKLLIRGSVDRVDIMQTSAGKYLRVVDYKTGPKKFLLNDVLNGINMQMLIYLFAISENGSGEYENLIPSSVMYLPASRKSLTLDRNADKSEVNDKINKELTGNGLVLFDEVVIQGINKSSSISSLSRGKVKGIPCDLISASEMGQLSLEIKRLLKEMGNMLHKGQIPSIPVMSKNHSNTCEYCDYSDVCVNKLNKSQREIEELDHSKVLELLNKEVENNA